MPLIEWKNDLPFKISKTISKGKKLNFYNYILTTGKKEVPEEDWELIKDECEEQIRNGNLRIISEEKKKVESKKQGKKNIPVEKE